MWTLMLSSPDMLKWKKREREKREWEGFFSISLLMVKSDRPMYYMHLRNKGEDRKTWKKEFEIEKEDRSDQLWGRHIWLSEQEGIKSVCVRVSVKVRVCYGESEWEGDNFCDVGHGELVIVQKRKKTNKRNKKR